jgi:hypothetical protein
MPAMWVISAVHVPLGSIPCGTFQVVGTSAHTFIMNNSLDNVDKDKDEDTAVSLENKLKGGR